MNHDEHYGSSDFCPNHEDRHRVSEKEIMGVINIEAISRNHPNETVRMTALAILSNDSRLLPK